MSHACPIPEKAILYLVLKMHYSAAPVGDFTEASEKSGLKKLSFTRSPEFSMFLSHKTLIPSFSAMVH